MNDYQALFSEIVAQTESGRLKWMQISKRANAELIYDPRRVHLQFSACFSRADHIFTLLLIEKNYNNYAADFTTQNYVVELLVVHENELVVTVLDTAVGRRALMRLLASVVALNDKTEKLFGSAA
jgi:hypothetical protein